MSTSVNTSPEQRMSLKWQFYSTTGYVICCHEKLEKPERKKDLIKKVIIDTAHLAQ